jgi:hypothetical protein
MNRASSLFWLSFRAFLMRGRIRMLFVLHCLAASALEIAAHLRSFHPSAQYLGSRRIFRAGHQPSGRCLHLLEN